MMMNDDEIARQLEGIVHHQSPRVRSGARARMKKKVVRRWSDYLDRRPFSAVWIVDCEHQPARGGPISAFGDGNPREVGRTSDQS